MKYRILYLLTVCCLLLAACEKQTADNDGPTPDGPGQDAPENPAHPYPDPIGVYTFDGAQYDLYTALYNEDDFAYYFIFSPRCVDEQEPLTTYFLLVLNKYFNGMTMEVERMAHNYDYYFIYEDPVRYYSQYRELQGGTMSVTSRGGDLFHVKLDIRLYDGTPLAIDYTGPFAKATETVAAAAAAAAAAAE